MTTIYVKNKPKFKVFRLKDLVTNEVFDSLYMSKRYTKKDFDEHLYQAISFKYQRKVDYSNPQIKVLSEKIVTCKKHMSSEEIRQNIRTIEYIRHHKLKVDLTDFNSFDEYFKNLILNDQVYKYGVAAFNFGTDDICLKDGYLSLTKSFEKIVKKEFAYCSAIRLKNTKEIVKLNDYNPVLRKHRKHMPSGESTLRCYINQIIDELLSKSGMLDPYLEDYHEGFMCELINNKDSKQLYDYLYEKIGRRLEYVRFDKNGNEEDVKRLSFRKIDPKVQEKKRRAAAIALAQAK